MSGEVVKVLEERVVELYRELEKYMKHIIEHGKVVGTFSGSYEDSDSWFPSVDYSWSVTVKEYKGIRMEIPSDANEADLWLKFSIAIKEAIRKGISNEITKTYEELQKAEEELYKVRKKIEQEQAKIVDEDEDLQELFEFVVRRRNDVSPENKYVRKLLGNVIESVNDIRYIIDPYGDLPMMEENAAKAQFIEKLNKIFQS